MPKQEFSPGKNPRTVRDPSGTTRQVPADWSLLPPGDATLTRRVKAAGDFWLVTEKKGRRTMSRGLWAATETIQRIQAELVAERSTDQYAKRQVAAAVRRNKVQTSYVAEFETAIRAFLNFHVQHKSIECRLAKVVATHATPIGSGTVARTKQIPIEQRAQAAVIAWLRHQTTGYDGMVIPRVKGKRREIRRMLAKRSLELLQRYRAGDVIEATCPLKISLGET